MTNPNNTNTAKYYIGLMSGTSADGIDLALVEFNDEGSPQLKASYYQAYSDITANQITSLYQPGQDEIDSAFHLDVELSKLFSQAIFAFLAQEKISTSDVIAIGNHGQTIRHRPNDSNAFTLQIGCCQTLATLTDIRVVGQFRRKDMALGGQGAPLVPIFHQQLFQQNDIATFVVNIGGIANLTYLPSLESNDKVMGFDTGPGNALLDDWFVKHHEQSLSKFDKNGDWAALGTVNDKLLAQLLSDQYFSLSAPKSTGREYFHFEWLQQHLKKDNVNVLPVDVQATLSLLTAKSICDAINATSGQGRVYLCGGGVHNHSLINALSTQLGRSFQVQTMAENDIDGDSLEAMAFAWLAYAFDNKLPSNLIEVTGASKSCTLGNEYLP